MMNLKLLRLIGEENYRISLRSWAAEKGGPVQGEEELDRLLAENREAALLFARIRTLREEQNLAQRLPGKEHRPPTPEELEALRRRGTEIRMLQETYDRMEAEQAEGWSKLPGDLAPRHLTGILLEPERLGAPLPAFPYPPKTGEWMGERLGLRPKGKGHGAVMGKGLELLDLLRLHLHRELRLRGYQGQNCENWFQKPLSAKGFWQEESGLTLWRLCDNQSDTESLRAVALDFAEILGGLGLSLGLTDIPKEELLLKTKGSARQGFRLETWSPAKEGYEPLCSFWDYGRMLPLSYGCTDGRRGGGEFDSLLSSDNISLESLLTCLYEVWQQDDGSIALPDSLAQIMGEVFLYPW